MIKPAAYYEDKIITIPNLFSFFRLTLIPVIIWLYCLEEKFMESAIVLVISGISDLVDGFIARRFHMISNFGKFLDPFADKMTQMTMLVCLAFRYQYMLIPFILLFVKELVSIVSAFIAYKKSGVVKGAEWHGKASTALLYMMIFVHIIWIDITPFVSKSLVVICTTMMLLSFVIYETNHIKRIFSVVKKGI